MGYEPYQPLESDPEPPHVKKFFTRSNWKTVMAVVVVIVVFSFVLNVLAYSQPWSKIRVTVKNVTDISLKVRAMLNVSGDFVSSETFTVSPHSAEVVVTWNLHAGTHQVFVLWGAKNISDSNSQAYPFSQSVSHSYHLVPFLTKNAAVETIADVRF